MVYGREGTFDADRLIDLLRALEAFRASERLPATSEPTLASEAVETLGQRSVGLVQDTEQTNVDLRRQQMAERRVGDRPTSWARSTATGSTREALSFLLSADGAFFRSFLVEETVKGLDCLGRAGLNALARRLAEASPLQVIPGVGRALLESPLGPFGDIFAPPLTAEEERVVENTLKVLAFLLGDLDSSEQQLSPQRVRSVASAVQRATRDPELATGARALALQLGRRLFDVVNARALRYFAGRLEPPRPSYA